MLISGWFTLLPFSDHSDDMYGIVAVCVSVSLSL